MEKYRWLPVLSLPARKAGRLSLLSAESEYVCQAWTELDEQQANEALELIDKLEQDEDVQKVYHTLA